MTPNTQLWRLHGELAEMLAARDEAVSVLETARAWTGDFMASPVPGAEAELAAIESGIQSYVRNKLVEVDDLREPLLALSDGVARCRAAARRETNRALELENRFERLKTAILLAMQALAESGYWKPKQTRKLESAHGSFTLRGNGGAQPVTVTDESLVPDNLCSADIQMSWVAWKELLALAGVEPDYASHKARRTPRLSAIGQELQLGPVAGCRLAPRGESLVVK